MATTTPRFTDLLEARLAGPAPGRLRIGLAMPLRGLLALNGHSVLESVLLATSEVENTRTRSERPVELVLFDSSGEATGAGSRVADVANAGIVDAMIGLHTSSTLEIVEGLVHDPVPYIFVPGHEGAPRREGYYCAGEAPDAGQQGVRWLADQRHVRAWAMLGTDYVWPRAMQHAIRGTVAAMGGTVVLDELIPLGSGPDRFQAFAGRVARSGTQGVVLNLPGRDLVHALNALRNRGLDRLVRFATTLEENVLLAIGGDSTANLYSMAHSFASMRTDRQRDIDARYRATFKSEAPLLTNWAQHAYDGLHLLVALDRVGQLDTRSLGTHDVDAASVPLRAQYRTYLAVAAGARFEVLATV